MKLTKEEVAAIVKESIETLKLPKYSTAKSPDKDVAKWLMMLGETALTLYAELEQAENYAKGLSARLEKAEVDNRTLLEQLQKAEAELKYAISVTERLEADLAETCKEYHATRDEVDRL